MFLSKLSTIVNTNQSRSVILTGNVYDLFYDGKSHVPLVDFLSVKYNVKPNGTKNGITQILYEVNSPIQIIGDKEELTKNWNRFIGDKKYSLDELCEKSNGNPTVAFEFLRQLTMCSRMAHRKNVTNNNLLIIVEAADMLLPEEKMSSMSLSNKRRIAILHDWFSDPKFIAGDDTVILIAESKSLIHSRVSRLPQVLSVEIDAPSYQERMKFLEVNEFTPAKLKDVIVRNTAGYHCMHYDN